MNITISQLANATGLTAKMIRYYEANQIVPAPQRTAADYRTYGESDISTYRFIAHARDLGFSLSDIKQLVQLRADPQRASREVKELANQQLSKVQQQIDQLQWLAKELNLLIELCPGDQSPSCPILNKLNGSA
ncbi:MAG: MerR family DNA-binding protein [Aliidiomarina sp.]|uniref:MerR family DNA-binding protein n=1 Tax=Aliidiomarina sp. TaxID=1872439 RepID=UPI0025C2D26F|nr:MerR family DNA-binding protein [Aliidiomarina sp.]MCH8502143.1 MerR family DNA-binding protein [Aliidiomarina sp.]